jgi:hypothetical protein
MNSKHTVPWKDWQHHSELGLSILSDDLIVQEHCNHGGSLLGAIPGDLVQCAPAIAQADFFHNAPLHQR